MQRKRYVFFHGIHSRGKGSVLRVAERVARAQHVVVDADIPVRSIYSATFTYKKDAQRALDNVREGDGLVGHSHGANVALEVAKHIPVRALFLFNPASPSNFDFSELQGTPRVTCVHSASDWAVRIGSWLPFNVFGRAGINGFDQLHEAGNPYGENINVKGTDHDDAFIPPALWYWSKEIIDNV